MLAVPASPGRRIGIILEFEKAEPEPGAEEHWRRQLSIAQGHCRPDSFRAWLQKQTHDRSANMLDWSCGSAHV